MKETTEKTKKENKKAVKKGRGRAEVVVRDEKGRKVTYAFNESFVMAMAMYC